MMKYWLIAILLSTTVYGAVFTVDTASTAGYGIPIQVAIAMDNLNPVYGYEFVLTSDLQHSSHSFPINTTVNSFVQLNQSAIRIAALAPAGIPLGSRYVALLNYTSNSTGNYSITISARAYSQNGSSMPVNNTGSVVTVNEDLLQIQSMITNHRIADVEICMRNSLYINSTSVLLDWNKTQMRLINATVAYNGSEIVLNSLTPQPTCKQIATLTFNITVMPGSRLPISVANLITSSPNPIATQNGGIQYNSFYLQCTGTSAYRNSTAYVQVQLVNYTAIDSWQYTVQSNLSLANGTNTTHVNRTATIPFQINNETDGSYNVVLLGSAKKGNTTILQNMQASCKINITTDCQDADNDTFFSGSECSQTTLDCDDTRAGVHPNATERCNKRDDDCDGQIDEGKVCKTASAGGSGGGGGGASSSNTGSATAGTASGGFSAFSNMMPREEDTYKQPQPPKEEHKPIQTKLEPPAHSQESVQKKPEPKKVNLVGHLMGALILLAAGIFLAYEHIRHKHKH